MRELFPAAAPSAPKSPFSRIPAPGCWDCPVTKSDRDTGEKLQGAVIGLYTAEKFKNQAGEVIAEADTLLESVMTDTEGKAIFECDLPFGRYYVKELTAPDGYYLSDDTQYFTFAYAEDSTEMVEFTLQIQNEPAPFAAFPYNLPHFQSRSPDFPPP